MLLWWDFFTYLETLNALQDWLPSLRRNCFMSSMVKFLRLFHCIMCRVHISGIIALHWEHNSILEWDVQPRIRHDNPIDEVMDHISSKIWYRQRSTSYKCCLIFLCYTIFFEELNFTINLKNFVFTTIATLAWLEGRLNTWPYMICFYKTHILLQRCIAKYCKYKTANMPTYREHIWGAPCEREDKR